MNNFRSCFRTSYQIERNSVFQSLLNSLQYSLLNVGYVGYVGFSNSLANVTSEHFLQSNLKERKIKNKSKVRAKTRPEFSLYIYRPNWETPFQHFCFSHTHFTFLVESSFFSRGRHSLPLRKNNLVRNSLRPTSLVRAYPESNFRAFEKPPNYRFFSRFSHTLCCYRVPSPLHHLKRGRVSIY